MKGKTNNNFGWVELGGDLYISIGTTFENKCRKKGLIATINPFGSFHHGQKVKIDYLTWFIRNTTYNKPY